MYPASPRLSAPPLAMAIGLALVVAPSSLSAQALPAVDTALTLRSADNDPDLLVARERYDAATRTQSLYLRVNDGTPDRQAFSGRLIVRGAEVVRVITSGEELAETDARWGLAGVPYEGAAVGRGLDGDAPLDYTPLNGDPNDAIRVEDLRSVRFHLGTDADIDDLRVLIRYPREPGPASFDVELFHAGRPDALGWSVTQQGGILVGSLTDSVPDDGDYSEVFDVHNLKLRVEDLDVVEDSLDFGDLPAEGGASGPLALTVDNFASGSDLDQDNGFDQNGLISPIPAGSDLEHVVYRVHPITNAAAGADLPADAVTIAEPADRVAVGEARVALVTVNVPAGLPGGAYSGYLEVFEDNSRDGVRNGAEPFDWATVTVIVGGRPDAAFDLGPPDFAVAESDAETPDGGIDAATTDGDVDSASADAGGTEDDAAGSAPDVGPSSPEAGPGPTGPASIGVPPISVAADFGAAVASVDSGDPRNGPGRPGENGDDGGNTTGPVGDVDADDAGIEPLPAEAELGLGTPRGGAFSCAQQPGGAPGGGAIALAALLVLGSLARTRRWRK